MFSELLRVKAERPQPEQTAPNADAIAESLIKKLRDSNLFSDR